jgi:hypothetical protein
MITFFKIVAIIGLIFFPIVKSKNKGVIEWFWIKGIVLGLNYDSMYFAVKKEDGEDQAYKLYNFQFHLFIGTITMSFSVKKDDIAIKES